MAQVHRLRNRRTGLLGRWPGDERANRWTAGIVDPAEQLEELADLRARGLLTAEEYERQRARVLEP